MDRITNKVYGNKALHKMLTNSIIGERLCHAYFFYGQPLVGKKTVAMNFAMQILCESENDTDKPCLSCKSCKKLLGANHPDVYLYDGKEVKDGKEVLEVKGGKESKEPKGGRNSLHIETIRMLRSGAYIKPNESKYKLYIIPNVENMTTAAANAFLKLLEEPPPHAVFILTAISKTSVPETILSRCISFEVFPLTVEEEKAALYELFPDKDKLLLDKAVIFSDGVLGRAVQFLSDDTKQASLALTAAVASAFVKCNEYELLSAVHKASASRQVCLQFIAEFKALLRAAYLQKLSVELTGDELVSLMAQKLTQKAISNAIGCLENAVSAIDGNVNLGLLEGNLTAELIACR